jgi:hypothetical protein
MFFGIIKWVLISLILILLIHYLYYYLKNTLTVPKVRDLIYKPQMQYNELLKYSEIVEEEDKKENKEEEDNNNDDKKYLEEDEMSAELKKYVEELNN